MWCMYIRRRLTLCGVCTLGEVCPCVVYVCYEGFDLV